MESLVKTDSFSKKPLKVSIVHHLLLDKCKGGGEKLMLQLKEHLNASFYTGAIDLNAWDPELCEDSFTCYLKDGKWGYLGQESKNKIGKYIKRQWNFLFSSKIKEIAQNDVVIFSFGNIAFVPQRLKKANPNIKLIAYVHTPPRNFTDQYESVMGRLKWYIRPFYAAFTKIVLWQFKAALKGCDHIITNSENIKGRLYKYCDVVADSVIFPLVEVDKFLPQEQGDFYLSHGRLEDLKRIKLIVKAFEKMPTKKLVITSGGPLEGWVRDYIKNNNIKNIDFKGRVSDEERNHLMASCLAGIYIPVDEDAGITQLEFMASGRPIVGVLEGGLIESVISSGPGQTGFLLPANPTEQQFIDLIESLDAKKLGSMKEACIDQSKKFDAKIFFEKFDKTISNL